MFKATVLFLSMFLLFGCGEKEEQETQQETPKTKVEKVKSLEESLLATKDKASCEKALSDYTNVAKPAAESSGLTSIVPPKGQCTETGWKASAE